jgi:hypothetical protein
MRRFASRPNREARQEFDSPPGYVTTTQLRFAPQPTDLRPATAPQVLTYDTGEYDSYEQEERMLELVSWDAIADAGDPPF